LAVLQLLVIGGDSLCTLFIQDALVQWYFVMSVVLHEGQRGAIYIIEPHLFMHYDTRGGGEI